MRSIDNYDDERESKTHCYYGSDRRGNYFYVKFQRIAEKESEVILFLSINEGSTIYELPEHPNTVIRQDEEGWSAQGLTIRVLEQDKRVRITFNGLLRKGRRKSIYEDINDDIEFVRLNFIYIASSKPCLSRSSCGSSWFANNRKLGPQERAHIDQYGSMMGEVRLENEESHELFLRGVRQFFVGKLKLNGTRMTLIGVDKIGNIFCTYSQDYESELKVNKLGHVKDPLDNLNYIESSTMNIRELRKQLSSEDFANASTYKFSAGKSYKLQITIQPESFKQVYGGYPWNNRTTIWTYTMELNGTMGIGLIEINDQYEEPCPLKLSFAPELSIENPLEPPTSDDYSLACVLDLNDPICKDESIAGGKGATLAQLKSLKSSKFIIPDGFCVTTYAFKHFLSQNKDLSDAINLLVDYYKTYYRRRRHEDIEPEKKSKNPSKNDLLENIAFLFTKANLPLEMQDEIHVSMSRLGSTESSLWTIRTSPIYENSDEITGPSNNETFFGMSTDKVVKFVLECWANVFSQTNIEYRHKNGLPLDQPVGVCIQLMVEPDSTGNLFSRNPVNGDPREICVSSTYGMSESISRGTVEPDEIAVRRRVDLNPHGGFRIFSTCIGRKNNRYAWDGSVHEVPVDQAVKLSISEKVILRLAEIARDLDELYGSARDIQWALRADKDEIYLLQCRPVANLSDDWTDFELSHELGSGVPADKDLLTFVQAGEIFPHCVTPLTCTTICEGLAPTTYSSAIRSWDDDQCDKNPLFIANMRVAFNYFNLMIRNCEETICKGMIARDYALCGRSIVTPEVHDAAKRRNCITGPIDRFKLLGGKLQDYLGGSQAKIDEFEKTIEYYAPKPDLSETEMMADLNQQLDTLYKVSQCYGHVSRSSAWYQVRVLSLLAGENKEITAQNFADFAQLLRHCKNVVSAQLPKIVAKIVDSRGWVRMRKHHPDNDADIEHWTSGWSLMAFEAISDFIQSYGHLGPNEFELASEPYVMRLDMIYAVLRFVEAKPDCNPRRRENSPAPKSKEEKEEQKKQDPKSLPASQCEPPSLSPAELVQEIKSTITPEARRTILKLLPTIHSGVARRELSKSLISKVVHNMRMLFCQKAADLVSDGKLPESDLIHYLSLWELRELLKDEAPYNTALIRKAQRRRKLWAELDKNRYLEFSYGMPRAIESDDFGPEVRRDKYVIYGTPICAGSACRRVVVARTHEEASKLRQWDILVAPSIDAGWSQYFPLLAGIITELGGILSQGAVMARENEVPCIMSVPNATRIFQTGDAIYIDGTTGKIERVSNTTRFFVQKSRINRLNRIINHLNNFTLETKN